MMLKDVNLPDIWRIAFMASCLLGLMMLLGVPAALGGREPEPPRPLAGLNASELAAFEEGRKVFESPFKPRQGLGPVFNARTCVACHRKPSVGGHGPGYRSNLRYNATPGSVEGLLFHGRSILTPTPEVLTDSALLSKRTPPSLHGLGLVEAIPQEAILAHADPDDQDGDGISGRPALRSGQLLRFGSQAHVGSLVEFIADALRQEMGLTSPIPGFAQEANHGEVPGRLRGRVPQPNVTHQTVRELVAFVALLAPPSRERHTFGAEQINRGERLFHQLSCARCHVPSYRTAAKPFFRAGDPSLVSTAALLDQEIAPYSDFLLHDLGPSLDDGIALGVAKPSEYKTAPLWGLRFRQHLLLHDGRANNIEQAILYHGGEAARSRARFLQIGRKDRQALIAFLKSL